MTLPLQNYSTLHSADLDQVREVISRAYRPHSLHLRSRHTAFDTRFHRISFGAVSFNYLQYGAEVGVDAGTFDTYFLVELPLSGLARIDLGDHLVESEGSVGTLISPTLPVHSIWGAGARRLAVQIDRTTLERFASDLMGVPVKRPMEFDTQINMKSGGSAELSGFIRHIVSQIDQHESFARHLLVRKQIERTLLMMILCYQRHNYSDCLQAVASPGAPKYVERAYEYIQENCSGDVSISDLIQVSGVSARTLFAGFKKYKGVAPMAALKRCRLNAVRTELCNPGINTSVTEVAFKWGFTHLGHFSQAYIDLFGERPSETLRKCR